MQLNELGRKEVWTKWLVISLAVLLSKSFVSNFLLNKLPEFVPGFFDRFDFYIWDNSPR